MQTLGGGLGSVTVIGAVSPQSGDFSEPVTQNTKRFTRCFWGLDRSLAYSRHYPAINWTSSYSEYYGEMLGWYQENVGGDFDSLRTKMNSLLHEESGLMEIVKLIGSDILPDDQKLILETARVIRVGFLQQSAFHETDTCVPIKKQLEMIKIIADLYIKARELVELQIPMSQIKALGLFEKLCRMRYEIPNENYHGIFDSYREEIKQKLNDLTEYNRAAFQKPETKSETAEITKSQSRRIRT